MSDKIIRILLIENNSGDARSIRETLADTTMTDPAIPSFDLTCARRLSSGLKRLAKGRFDVLLLDLSLPDSQGLDAFVKARAQAPETPVVILSDGEDRRLALDAMRQGAQDYLVKGEVSGSLLVRAIQYAIERGQAEGALCKRIERELGESEEKFRMLAEQSPNMIFINRRGRVLYANKRCEEIMGYTREEFYSADFDFVAITAPEYVDLVKARFAQHMRGKDVEPYEYALITKDGERIEAIITPRLIDYEGESAILGIITDITERKRAEEALRRREHDFSTLVENAADMIVRFDADLRHVYCNPAVERQLGVPVQTFLGKASLELDRLREQREFIDRSLRQALETGEELEVEQDYPTPFGLKHFQTRIVPERDASGHIESLLAITRDVTEHKRAEEALRESEQRYRFITEKMTDSVWLMDMEFKPTFISPSVTRALGYTLEELQALSLDELLTPASFEFAMKTVATGLSLERLAPRSYERSATVELEFRRKDGSTLWSESTITLFRDSEGRPTGFLGVGRDITERKRSEEALRESEERYRRLIEQSLMGIGISHKNQVLFANPALLRMFGYDSLEEFARIPLLDHVVPASRDRIASRMARLAQGEPVESDFEYDILRKDGKTRTLYASTTHIVESGEIHTQTTFLDITERKQAEEALRGAEAEKEAILDSQLEHVVYQDREHRILWPNQAACESVGMTREELVGRYCYEIWAQRSEHCEDCPVALAMMTGQQQEIEKTTPDGRAWFIRGYPVRDVNDETVGAIEVTQDITERKQAEVERERLLAQVREQVQRVQHIVDTIPEGVILLDLDLRVLLANPLGKKDLDALASARVGDVLTHLGDRPIEELLTSPPKGLWHEVTVEHRSFQVIARPIENGPTSKGWVLVVRDVTQQREVERRIQQQERLATVGQLAAGMAHDFNNIMAVIVLYAGLSLHAPDLPEEMRERLQTIGEQAHRASSLIQQILDFSRRAVLERGPLDLVAFLKEQIKLLQRTLPEHIQIDMSYDEDEYTVNADPTRIQQVVMNLATNARDAMPEGGRLHFALERIAFGERDAPPLPEMEPGQWIRLTVADTGMGISSEARPHIFDPFFTTKEPGKGFGLGLAQVYGIVKQHKGHIDFTTEPGRGTTFTLYLPALSMPQPSIADIESEPLPQGQGQTILVVEDETATRRALVESLRVLNYRVLEAMNGEQALEIFEQHARAIDLVLSDVVMPKMGGKALLYALQERAPAVRLVLLTGHPLDEQELEDLRALGLRSWTLKPLSLEQLARVMAEALGPVSR
jgi:two-component system cell cycle sensor histidine kinase/response regulator CckA